MPFDMPALPTAPVPGLRGARGIFFDYDNYVLVTMNDGYWVIDKKTFSDDILSAKRESQVSSRNGEPQTSQPKSDFTGTSQPTEKESTGTRDYQQTLTNITDFAKHSKQLDQINQEVIKDWTVDKDQYGSWYFPKEFLGQSVTKDNTNKNFAEYSDKIDNTKQSKRLDQINPEVLKDWTVDKDQYGSWYFPKEFLGQSATKDNTSKNFAEYSGKMDNTKRLEQVNPEVFKDWNEEKDEYGTWYFPKHFLRQSVTKDNTSRNFDEYSDKMDNAKQSKRLDQVNQEMVEYPKDGTIEIDQFGTWIFYKAFLEKQSKDNASKRNTK